MIVLTLRRSRVRGSLGVIADLLSPPRVVHAGQTIQHAHPPPDSVDLRQAYAAEPALCTGPPHTDVSSSTATVDQIADFYRRRVTNTAARSPFSPLFYSSSHSPFYHARRLTASSPLLRCNESYRSSRLIGQPGHAGWPSQGILKMFGTSARRGAGRHRPIRVHEPVLPACYAGRARCHSLGARLRRGLLDGDQATAIARASRSSRL